MLILIILYRNFGLEHIFSYFYVRLLYITLVTHEIDQTSQKIS